MNVGAFPDVKEPQMYDIAPGMEIFESLVHCGMDKGGGNIIGEESFEVPSTVVSPNRSHLGRMPSFYECIEGIEIKKPVTGSSLLPCQRDSSVGEDSETLGEISVDELSEGGFLE